MPDKKKIFLSIAGGISIFLFCIGSLTIMERNPQFCGYCHIKSGHFKTWEESGHGTQQHEYFGKVVCALCHVEPGVRGLIKSKFDAARHLWVTLLNYPDEYIVTKRMSVTLPSVVCEKCHRGMSTLNYLGEKDIPKNLRDLGLRMSHRVHIDRSSECRECHGPNAKKQFSFSSRSKDILKSISNPQRKTIFSSTSIMSCTACHEDIVHRKTKRYKKNIPLESTCEKCHRDNAKCKRAGPIFSVKDSSACRKCHPNHFQF